MVASALVLTRKIPNTNLVSPPWNERGGHFVVKFQRDYKFAAKGVQRFLIERPQGRGTHDLTTPTRVTVTAAQQR